MNMRTDKADNAQRTWLACICFCSSACSWGAWAVMSRAFLYTSLLGSYKLPHSGNEFMIMGATAHTRWTLVCGCWDGNYHAGAT